MSTSVLHDAKLWLTSFCSLPDEIVQTLELKLGRSPYDSKVRWTKRTASDVNLQDCHLTRLEKELEKPRQSNRKTSLQERVTLMVNHAKAIQSGLKNKIEAKFSGKINETIEIEISCSSSSSDEEDYEKGYDIVEVHNHIFIIGGSSDRSGDPVSMVEVYDCHSNQWYAISPLPIQTTACTATKIPYMPALVVIGGYAGWRALNTIQKYDFVTKKWEVLEHMRRRRWGALALGTDHGIFVAGGCDQGSVLKSAELYSVKKRQWYRLTSMLTPRCNFSGAVLGNNIVVAGGGSGFYFNSAMDSVELFDGSKGKWEHLQPMKNKRYGCCAVARNNLFIVLGGCDEHGQDIQEVEVFSEKAREWSFLSPLPISASLCRALMVDGNLVVFGADGINRTAYQYDFDEQKWTLFTKLPNSRNGFAVANIGV